MFNFFKKNKKKAEEKEYSYYLITVLNGIKETKEVDPFFLDWFVTNGKDLDFDECYVETIEKEKIKKYLTD